MTGKQYKVWAHPQYAERSPTAQENGWILLEEFDFLENAQRYIQRLSKDGNQWFRTKSYRLEMTSIVGQQVNVTRKSSLKAYVDPLKGVRDG